MDLPIEEIIRLYEKERWTLRMIAEKFNTDHHKIKRRLIANGINITVRKTLKKITEERRHQISKQFKGRLPWCKGLIMKDIITSKGIEGKDILYKNMKTHLTYDVSLEWLMQFEDIEKLKFLNKSVTRVEIV